MSREAFTGDFEVILLPKKTRSGLNLQSPLGTTSLSIKGKRHKNAPVRHWEKTWVRIGHMKMVRWVATGALATPQNTYALRAAEAAANAAAAAAAANAASSNPSTNTTTTEKVASPSNQTQAEETKK